jgi:signal transduction histidine kinase
VRLEFELRVAGRVRGALTLVQRGKLGGADDGFLPEERSLLETVAQQVGAFVERVEGERARAGMELQLRHADRLAAIGQLAAGVAHELNAPLGNVLGFAQLALRAEGVPDQVRADLSRIVEASLHGREIVRKLLVFARQAPASKHPVGVNAIIEESMFLLEAGCESPRIRFERELAPALPLIEADPVQVRQVVTNLVINAMQAIEGEGVITVRTSAEPGAVVLAVQDTGAGMTPEVARHAFEPFFTTKDVGQGTGLGLSVVEGIVAGHGGTVELRTEPGRGSTFRVRLPASAP